MAASAAETIDRVLSLTSRLPKEDSEIQNEWTKYLILFIVGKIEVDIINIFKKYAKEHGDHRIANFMSSNFDRFGNASPIKLKDLLGRMDKDWSKKFEEFCKEEIGDSIQSLVNLRNNLAHGRDVDPRINDVQKYAECAKKLLGFLSELVK